MKVFKSKVFSPKGFLIRALLIFALYLLLHFLGLRDYTCILTGTSPSGNPNDYGAIVFGLCYCLVYFSTVGIVPILVLSCGIFFLLLKFFPAND